MAHPAHLNCVVSLEDLEASPSSKHGMSRELEWNCRRTGAQLIQSAGLLLKLPQAAMATAQILFQRYYSIESFVKKPLGMSCMGCLFVASKVEESPRRIRDILSVFDYLVERETASDKGVILLRPHSSKVEDYTEKLLKAELDVLAKLGFDVHVQHPHGFLLNMLNALNLTSHQELVQLAWNYLNDGLQTTIYICYQPSVIACAAVYLASRKLGIPLCSEPEWYLIFDTCLQDLENIAGAILRLYTKPLMLLKDIERETDRLYDRR